MLNKCLKFSHFFIGGFILFILSSCLLKNDHKLKSSKEQIDAFKSILKLAESCRGEKGKTSEIYKRYIQFDTFLKQKNVKYNYGVSNKSTNYNYSEPLIINEKILDEELKILSKQVENGEVIAEDLNLFLQKLTRFESMKCQFSNLSVKRTADLRPYLKLLHSCYQYFESDSCEQAQFDSLYKLNFKQTLDLVMELCQTIESDKNCIDQLRIAMNSNQIGHVSSIYFNEFQKQRYFKLFQIKPNSFKFNCSKKDNLIELKLKIYQEGFSDHLFAILKNNIQEKWTKNGLVLVLAQTTNPDLAHLKIMAIDQGVSFVRDSEPDVIYLNRNLDYINLQIVAAHEFGHILGFPDCYVEFFDRKSASLIYFELSSKNKNLMCTTRESSKVPNDYIDQIMSNTCKFN